MIEPIEDLPAGVIGFVVTGKIHAADYTQTLGPAVERAAAAGGVRLVLVFEEFDGLSAGGTWQDLKMGVGHLGAWKRTALVTDIEWMSHLVHLFGWMSPGEFEQFPLAGRADAIAWAAG
jgi:hypothetical protein